MAVYMMICYFCLPFLVHNVNKMYSGGLETFAQGRTRSRGESGEQAARPPFTATSWRPAQPLAFWNRLNRVFLGSNVSYSHLE